MLATGPASGVVVRVALPPTLEVIRRNHADAAANGAPAHVTVLFPFLPASKLTPALRRELATICRAVAPFDVRFALVRQFPGVVYLVPEPAAPFVQLTAAFAAHLPDHPPYGGAFDEVIPHLTLADSDEAPLDAIAAATHGSLPFRQHVSAVELLTESAARRWHRHWRIPLGIRR